MGDDRNIEGNDSHKNTEAQGRWPQKPARPQPPPGDDPMETRVLPIVEPSRFDRGGQSRPAPAAPPPPPRPQAVRAPDAQPHVRKPGGWQYEREEADSIPTKAGTGGRAGADPRRGYLSVSVQGARRRSFGWFLWVVLGVLVIALVSGLAFVLAWQGQYAGKVYAGLSVLDEDLSGKSPDAAKKLLREKVQPFVARPVTLTWRGKEWRPTAEQLGVKVDVDASVDEAYRVGRDSDLFTNLIRQWDAAQSGYGAPVVVQINEPAMQTYLGGLAGSEIDQELFEGDVRLDGGRVVAMPGKEGRTLRVYDSITAIRESVAKLEPGELDLPVDTVRPSVTVEEVKQVESLLAVRVSGPITATAPSGKILTLDLDALARFTTIERNPDRSAPRHIELGWKEHELKILGERWAEEAVRPAQNARFAWNNGALSVLSESAEGFETDLPTVISSIKEHSATSDKREYALPGKVITPTVSSKDIGALGIEELMGTGASTFRGSSQERATNIRVAANLLNGAVVPPGGTFSFLQTMGGIDEAHGFVEGYVIAAERTQRGVGGGVCQVSTTAFRAAFWSGLPITERNQHSYRVGWYESNGEPVGFDAAVFDPGVDLKFTNDTPTYILVEATAGSDTITVNFYGTKRPGVVKLEGPAVSNRAPPPPDVYQVDTRLPPGTKKQVETARGGLDTVITRRTTLEGQPDKIDQFHSQYRAWPNWYMVASPAQVPGGVQTQAEPTPNP